MPKLYKIRFLKDTELKKTGEIAEATKKNAESAVSQGYAEYVVEEPKTETAPTKEKPTPDYVGYDTFIEKFVEGSTAEQLQGVEEGIKKFNLGKTEANKILREKVSLLNKQRKEEERKQKEELLAKEKVSKEYDKRKKEAEKKAEEDQKKELLDEIEVSWETCGDDLFQAVCEADWRKAKFYFGKRLLKENSYIELPGGEMTSDFYSTDEGEVIVGIKTFQDNKEMLIYNPKTGEYDQDAEINLMAGIERRLGEKATNMQVKEIIDSIKRQTYYDREELQKQPKHLRPVDNGLWNIEEKKLQDFTPEYVFLNKVTPGYNPRADCPAFKKFLTDVLDSDIEIKVLQEWLGYCLLLDARFSKALLLFGDGENGKSVLLKVIKQFLGYKNVTSISLQYLESNPFAPVRMFGKLGNIFADLPKKALSQTSVFKMVVAGDSISGEKKGKDSFEFNPYAKMMFSCNEVPRTPDRTRGFFRRWIILKFNQHFPEGHPKRDETLAEKLSTKESMEGILNFALEGLYRLLENKRFTEHMSRAEIEEFWLRHSDSVSAFCLDLIETDATKQERKQDVWDTYESYCKVRNYPAEEPNAFWRRFKEMTDYQEVQEKQDNDSRIRVCKGFKLKSLDSISIENGGQDA
jgi:P4 family phage/plasmid primase-like protien